MLFPRSQLRCCLLVLTIVYAGSAQAQAEPAVTARVPVATFFDGPDFGVAVLSPNAKFLAITKSYPDRRVALYVMDLATKKEHGVAEYDDMDVGAVQWVNDERLMFDMNDGRVGQRDVKYYPGLFAVNRDGSNLRQLADFGYPASTTGSRIRTDPHRLPWNTLMLEQHGTQDSDYVYVRRPVFQDETLRYVDLLRLNTVTGKSNVVKRPADVQQWMLDNKGEPRVTVAEEKGVTTVYVRDPAGDEWRKLASSKLFADKNIFIPLGFAPDGTLYVNTNNGINDTTAIHTYNFATGQLAPQPVITTAGYDFRGQLISSREKVLGMRFTTDAESTIWFDEKMTALQKRVDDLRRTTINMLQPAAHPETGWILVESYSDVRPNRFDLFNAETGEFRWLGSSKLGIAPGKMGRQVQLSFKARDGLTIPVLLTLPPGKRKNLPMVVLIHGGPWVRGSTWGWAPESQFLASRGYAVLEPAFRGTTGLGNKHYVASFKQWGLAMQDDIADAAKFAIEQGYADPQRICLAGASYGGYATLMGLIRDPQLFKCGVNWVGVTDIDLLLNGHWSFKSDMTDTIRDYTAPEKIGDLVKDKEKLRASSPLHNAARITQPLLLAYGGADMRVPKYHGDKFYNAVKATNKDVEWIVYEEEGHGWVLPHNRIDFWGRVEKFLDRHIGKP